ncbi:MAG: lysophospholipid acyltransferase family protein [Planctomycetaceae bacterium]|nr:lysophospholipid acyltransferase family protein [Planctomycetaceae bacterium]
MKLRHPLAIRLVAFLAALLIRLWMSTIRVRVISADGQPHPADPSTTRYLYAFWHETLLAPLVRRRLPARVLISQHADGELIAQVCQFLGIGVVRGSTARGGSQALMEMIRGGNDDRHLAITPDGPRGPRREIKPGIIMVASQTSLAIVPIGVGFTRAWRAGSWDRFAVPYPLSTIAAVIGEPIAIPDELDRGGMQACKQAVQAELLRLTQAAEDWAEQLSAQGRRAAPPEFKSNNVLRKSA